MEKISNPLFSSINIELFHIGVRDDPKRKVYRCLDSGLIFLEPHPKGLCLDDEMYQGLEWIPSIEGKVDYKKLNERLRTENNKRVMRNISMIRNKNILDIGCGSGSFLFSAKEHSNNCIGVEINNSSREYVRSNGIQVYPSLDEIDEKFDTIFLNHVLEHVENPSNLINRLKDKLSKNGKVIIEVPHGNDALLTHYNCDNFKNFTLWSEHLYLFTEDSFMKIMHKKPFEVTNVNYLMRFSISNHLYWLKEGKPKGQEILGWIESEELNQAYSNRLVQLKATDTIEFTLCLKTRI
jgi:2-polyprenyl-3-methyl-5-hydroxy-6-metoxy-1,4-benzoquinol methylase